MINIKSHLLELFIKLIIMIIYGSDAEVKTEAGGEQETTCKEASS